jgi:LysM repeat protein
MKILKICGIVVGVHVLALLMIISPGCSASKGQSTPAVAPEKSEAPAPVAAPADLTMPVAAPAPVPAPDASAPSSGILYSPTRPGTPAASALETPPVTGVTPATTYTVVSGDNLSTIAKKNHLKSSELAKANNLRSGSPLHIGQKLLIPAKAESVRTSPAAAKADAAPAPAAASPAAMPAAGPAKAPGESVKHTVKSGETLGAIARKYGVRVGDIATANAITDPQKIHAGQELIIPGGSVRAGKSSAAKAAKPAAAPAPAPAAPAESAPAPAAAAPVPAPAGNDIPVIKIDDAAPAAAPKP